MFFRIVPFCPNCTTGYVFLRSILGRGQSYYIRGNYECLQSSWISSQFSEIPMTAPFGPQQRGQRATSPQLPYTPLGSKQSEVPSGQDWAWAESSIISWVCLTQFTQVSKYFQADSQPFPYSWKRILSNPLILEINLFPLAVAPHKINSACPVCLDSFLSLRKPFFFCLWDNRLCLWFPLCTNRVSAGYEVYCVYSKTLGPSY